MLAVYISRDIMECIFNVNIDERVTQCKYLKSFHYVVEWLVVQCAGNQIIYLTHQGRMMQNYTGNIVCVGIKQLAHNNICRCKIAIILHRHQYPPYVLGSL